jgi:uroporphyrinogen decarboxylase
LKKMAQTSREIVAKTLKFDFPERIPRDMWVLPWADIRYPETVSQIRIKFPSDFCTSQYFYVPSERVNGNPYSIGNFTDEWGCNFINVQEGVIGEVKEPIVSDLNNWKIVKPPYEQLPENSQPAYDTIKKYYDSTDKFVFSNICPRPWERYQFLRGTENALMDMVMPEYGVKELLQKIRDFYLKEFELWAKSDIDALNFMDDWGAQRQLLIPPDIWREIFKPIYKEYCDLAHAYGKFIFMHSDGNIQEIYPDLIEIGVDALNSQLFCMDLEVLSKTAKGKITFWGEIDRQHILPSKNSDLGREAVQKVAKYLFDPSGGIIAQFEFGAGANPETALAIFDEWSKIEMDSIPAKI